MLLGEVRSRDALLRGTAGRRAGEEFGDWAVGLPVRSRRTLRSPVLPMGAWFGRLGREVARGVWDERTEGLALQRFREGLGCGGRRGTSTCRASTSERVAALGRGRYPSRTATIAHCGTLVCRGTVRSVPGSCLGFSESGCSAGFSLFGTLPEGSDQRRLVHALRPDLQRDHPGGSPGRLPTESEPPAGGTVPEKRSARAERHRSEAHRASGLLEPATDRW